MAAHLLWIVAHAASATLALISAGIALRTGRLIAVHAVSTLAMAVTLAPSLWLSRTTNPAPLQLIFLALLGLSVVMSYRGVQAWRCLPTAGRSSGPRYIAAVGFNLIGLVTGLVTVGVLRLGWGGIAVLFAAVAIPALGHLLLSRMQHAACEANTV